MVSIDGWMGKSAHLWMVDHLVVGTYLTPRTSRARSEELRLELNGVLLGRKHGDVLHRLELPGNVHLLVGEREQPNDAPPFGSASVLMFSATM